MQVWAGVSSEPLPILFVHTYNYYKMKTAGLIIILIGLGLTVVTAFTYFTKEKVVDIGKVEITRDKPHNLNWSPLIGVAVMGVGGVVLLLSYKK